MRLLFTCQRYGEGIVGGSEFATRQFAERLSILGHEVTVVTSCAMSYTDWSNVFPPGVDSVDGVRVVRLPVVAPRDARIFGGLHDKVLRRSDAFLFEEEMWARTIGPRLAGYEEWLDTNIDSYDVAVFKSYLYFPTTQGLPLVAGRIPTVFHAEAHPEEMLDLGLYDGLFRLPDAYQFGTPEECELIRQRFGFEPIGRTVGVGIDEFRRPEAGRIEPSERSSEHPDPYLLVLGRYGGGKGSERALEFFTRFRAETSSGVKLVFVGERPHDLSSIDGVEFAGYVTDEEKVRLLSGAVCLLQPSLLESFSIVLIEAWNEGVPVLADGRCAVVAGQVARSGGGLLYENYATFEKGLSALLEGAQREDLGVRGRSYVSANYTWQHVLDRFLDVVELAISRFAER